MTTLSNLTVLIPVYDDEAGLRTTLQSLRCRYPAGQSLDIIVCDDCGPPGIAALAVEYGCRHVRLPSNSGSYAARNAGLCAARTEFLAFLDADQEIVDGWAEAGMAALQTAPYVGGRIVIRGGDSSDPWIRYDRERGFPSADYVRNAAFPTGNLFVSRVVLESLGGFREELRSTGDTEFASRVRNAGLDCGHAPEAISIHPPRDKQQQFRKNRRIASGRAQLYLVIERQPFARVVGREAVRTLLSSLRLGWRLFKRRGERRRNGVADYVRFLLYDEALLLHRAFWVAFYSRQALRRGFRPFQDPSLARRIDSS